ncbi:MAG: zinc transporter ZupT [Spirochaetota bacterium]
MEGNFWFALSLTVFAGLSTGIGSLIGLLSKKFNPKILTMALGFSAGVMIYVSLVEIFVKARVSLSASFGDKAGYLWTVVAFFIGMFLIALIDKVIPSYENPHEMNTADKISQASEREKGKLLRMGVFSALAIGIHNFPEGLATFMGGLSNPALGVSIAVAIAIHNIPEGLAVSAPIYFATKSRKKAFLLSFLSGCAEPIGALFGYFLLRSFFTETTFGFVFAGVAGIMVYISLDELLPTAEEYGEHHLAIGGLIAGMIVMAVSLILFM